MVTIQTLYEDLRDLCKQWFYTKSEVDAKLGDIDWSDVATNLYQTYNGIATQNPMALDDYIGYYCKTDDNLITILTHIDTNWDYYD